MLFPLVFSQLIIYLVFGIILGSIEKINWKKSFNKIIEIVGKIFFLNVLPRYIFYWGISGHYSPIVISNFISNMILYTFVQDIIFSQIHYIIHIEPFYTLIHLEHHLDYHTYTYGIFGKLMSKWDFIMFELMNFPLKLLFFNYSIKQMWLVDVIDYILTICSHSKLFDLNGHHKIHHYHPEYNFGITPLSDYLFGSLYKK